MQPPFVSDGLLAWGKTQCHHCDRSFKPSQAQINSSAPRTSPNGQVVWVVHVACPRCHGTVGLILLCKIIWPQVREWLAEMERFANAPTFVDEHGKPIPSRRNPNAAVISTLDLGHAIDVLGRLDSHQEFLQIIGVKMRDIYPPQGRKKRRPKKE
jgi:hypothetical protein